MHVSLLLLLIGESSRGVPARTLKPHNLSRRALFGEFTGSTLSQPTPRLKQQKGKAGEGIWCVLQGGGWIFLSFNSF